MAELIYRYLDTNGDGTGTKNANGNYSVTPDDFYYQPKKRMFVHRMLISLEDTTGMIAEEYGNLGAQLTNGWSLEHRKSNDVVDLDFNDGIPIKSNAQIGRSCYDVDLKTWGNGNELLVARWSFDKAGRPLKLRKNEKLAITFSDDFSGLITHYFQIQGVRY